MNMEDLHKVELEKETYKDNVNRTISRFITVADRDDLGVRLGIERTSFSLGISANTNNNVGIVKLPVVMHLDTLLCLNCHSTFSAKKMSMPWFLQNHSCLVKRTVPDDGTPSYKLWLRLPLEQYIAYVDQKEAEMSASLQKLAELANGIAVDYDMVITDEDRRAAARRLGEGRVAEPYMDVLGRLKDVKEDPLVIQRSANRKAWIDHFKTRRGR